MIDSPALRQAMNERAEGNPMYQDDPLCDLLGVAEQPEEVRTEYRLDCIIRDLDELCGLAKEGKVSEYAAGQILTRAQLIASFLEARRTPKFKVISNG